MMCSITVEFLIELIIKYVVLFSVPATCSVFLYSVTAKLFVTWLFLIAERVLSPCFDCSLAKR
jgi:hypothetical protein